MPTQCGTQWDGLGHIPYGNHMWNGYDCRNVTSAGAQKCGIGKTKERMVGRGVPGPVYLGIPADWFGRHLAGVPDLYAEPAFRRTPAGRVAPIARDVERAIALLASAEKPVLVAGGGVILSEAWAELTSLAEALNIPVVHIVMNNCSLAFEYHVQKYVHQEMCPEASEFLDVPFGDVARAFGAHGERVTSAEQLIPALRRAEESGKPAIVDVAVSWELPPPVTRYEAAGLRKI